MKLQTNKFVLPAITGVLGTAALALRLALAAFGTDEKGLLVPSHPLAVSLWLFTAAAVAFLLLSAYRLYGSGKYTDNFPACPIAAAGNFLLAAGICCTVFTELGAFLLLGRIRNILGLLSIPALTWLGVCRRRGQKPFFAAHAVVCLFLTLFTVSRYQSWSSQTQLLRTFFPMMACILLILFSYHHTAFDVDMGRRRSMLATGLLAAFFCFSALSGKQDILLYLTGGIWALTNLCCPVPVRNRRKNPLTAPSEETP